MQNWECKCDVLLLLFTFTIYYFKLCILHFYTNDALFAPRFT
jgi:hypothetical protein